MRHRYEGACPDDTQPDARDPECAACMTPIVTDAMVDRFRESLWSTWGEGRQTTDWPTRKQLREALSAALEELEAGDMLHGFAKLSEQADEGTPGLEDTSWPAREPMGGVIFPEDER